LRPAGLRARERPGARVLWRRVQRALDGFRKLCGGSREVWRGCRRFLKVSGEVLGSPGGVLGGGRGLAGVGFEVP